MLTKGPSEYHVAYQIDLPQEENVCPLLQNLQCLHFTPLNFGILIFSTIKLHKNYMFDYLLFSYKIFCFNHLIFSLSLNTQIDITKSFFLGSPAVPLSKLQVQLESASCTMPSLAVRVYHHYNPHLI